MEKKPRRAHPRWRRIARALTPPNTIPRDLVHARVQNRELIQTLASSAWLVTVGTFCLMIIKIAIFFRGDVNPITAVLERASLSGIAMMTLSSMGLSFMSMAPIFLPALVYNASLSKKVRIFWVSITLYVIMLLPSSVTRLSIVLGVTAYAFFAWSHEHPRAIGGATDKSRTGLEYWGSKNLNHEDSTLRLLALKASRAGSLNDEDKWQLRKDVNDRLNLLQPSPLARRALTAWTLLGGYAFTLLVSPPAFSASYEVEVAGMGPTVAYVVHGEHDALVIESRQRRIRVAQLSDVQVLRLCGRSNSNSGLAWLTDPILPPLGAAQGDCTLS